VDTDVKGYMVQFAGRFVAEDPLLSKKVPQALLDEIRLNQTEIKPTGWVAREALVKIYRAIVAVHGDEERGAYDDLVRCGTVMGGFATNTFLKLLLKMMTPRLFARKFPDLWARDHKRGRIEIISIDEHSMVMLFKDMEGYDHFAPVAVGWGGSTLNGIGVKDLEMKVDPWSLTQPTAAEVRVVATWK
jgi:hypothetical protein